VNDRLVQHADIQNRVPDRSSPAALNTGASSASSEHALATRCADSDSHACHSPDQQAARPFPWQLCGSVMRRSMISRDPVLGLAHVRDQGR